MFNLNFNKRWRWKLYPSALFWPIWLFGISDIFTMGYYTPLPTRTAITVVTLMIPATLFLTRTWDGIITAILFAVMTWYPMVLLWWAYETGRISL